MSDSKPANGNGGNETKADAIVTILGQIDSGIRSLAETILLIMSKLEAGIHDLAEAGHRDAEANSLLLWRSQKGLAIDGELGKLAQAAAEDVRIRHGEVMATLGEINRKLDRLLGEVDPTVRAASEPEVTT